MAGGHRRPNYGGWIIFLICCVIVISVLLGLVGSGVNPLEWILNEAGWNTDD